MNREVSGVAYSFYNKRETNGTFSGKSKADVKQQYGTILEKTPAKANVVEHNFVDDDRIFKEGLFNQARRTKDWATTWGFMCHQDPLVNTEPVEGDQVPAETVPYSLESAATTGSEYGARLATEPGQTMQELEFKMYSANRKKKLGRDLMCS